MDWKVLPALWTCLGTRLCTRIGALPKGPPRARSFVCMESGTIREPPRLGAARRGSAGHDERVAYSRAGCPEGLARTAAGRLDVLECATVPSRNGLDMRAMAAHLRNRSFGENWRCSLFARCRIGTIGANRSSESPLCRQPYFSDRRGWRRKQARLAAPRYAA